MNSDTGDAKVTEQARAAFQELFARVSPSMGFTSDASAVFVRAGALKHFEAGTSIVSGTDRNVLLYFLVDGAVRVTCNLPRHALTIEFVKPGRFFGLGSLFDPPGPRCLGAIAHTPCLVAIITPEVAAQAIAALPSCAALQLLAYSWRGRSRRVYRQSRTTVMTLSERLLFELRLLAHDFGRPVARGTLIAIPLTNADLATLVGASRAAAARALDRLQRWDVIERNGGSLVLLDPSISALRVAPLGEAGARDDMFPASGPHASQREGDADDSGCDLPIPR